MLFYWSGRLAGEWVLVVHGDLDENLEILAGEVWAHSSDVDVICKSMALTKGMEASIEYIGEVKVDFAAIF